MIRYLLLVLVLALAPACTHAPPSLSPAGAVLYVANEANVAMGVLQDAAIGLNAIRVCTPPAPCHPLLSDANTKIIVEAITDVVTTNKALPAGWKATVNAGLARISLRLDEAGRAKLHAYLDAARMIIDGL